MAHTVSKLPLELSDEVRFAQHLLARSPKVHDSLGRILRVRYSHGLNAEHHAHGLAHNLHAHRRLRQRLDLVRLGLLDGVESLGVQNGGSAENNFEEAYVWM